MNMNTFQAVFASLSRSLSAISNMTFDSELLEVLEVYSNKKTSQTTPDMKMALQRENVVRNILSGNMISILRGVFVKEIILKNKKERKKSKHSLVIY